MYIEIKAIRVRYFTCSSCVTAIAKAVTSYEETLLGRTGSDVILRSIVAVGTLICNAVLTMACCCIGIL